MSLDPDVVTRKSFENSFRGYDPMEVQAYLLVLADELRAGRDREFELELRLSEADRRAREAQAEAARLNNQPPPPGPPSLEDLDHAELARLLGDETARVLEAARTGAAEMRAKAEAEAEATVAEAAARARARVEVAEEEAERRRDETECEVTALRRETEADCSELRTAALAEAEAAGAALEDEVIAARTACARELDELRSAQDEELAVRRAEIEAEIEALHAAAMEECAALRASAEAEQTVVMEATRAVVREAREFRKEVLTDLAARRHAARAQLEQLAAARDHLLEALGTSRATLDELYGSTDALLDAARERADVARDRADSDAPASVEELEAFLVARRGDVPVAKAPEVDGREIETPENEATETVIAESIVAETAMTETVDGPVDAAEPEVVTSLFARIRADADAFIPPTVPEPSVVEPGVEVVELPDVDLLTEGPVDASAQVSDLSETAPPAVSLAESTPLEVIDARPDADRDLLDRRARALAGPERGLGRVLKRLLSEEQNELLDAVRRTRDLPTVDALLGSEDDHAVRYAAAARAELRDAAYAGAHLLDAAAGGAERPDVDDLAAQIGVDIVAPLRERLEGCWSDAAANEMELIELARGTYRQWRTKVLPELTHHYVALAFNRGLTAASGAEAQRWLVDAGS